MGLTGRSSLGSAGAGGPRGHQRFVADTSGFARYQRYTPGDKLFSWCRGHFPAPNTSGNPTRDVDGSSGQTGGLPDDQLELRVDPDKPVGVIGAIGPGLDPLGQQVDGALGDLLSSRGDRGQGR